MAEGWNCTRSPCRNGIPAHENDAVRNSASAVNDRMGSSNLCRYFLRGHCVFDNRCRYVHERPHEETINANCNNNTNGQKNQHSTRSNSSSSEQSFSTGPISTCNINNLHNNCSDKKSSKKNNNKHKNQENIVKNSKVKLADFVNAPEFIPKAGSEKSYACAFEPDNGSTASGAAMSDESDPLLCPYAIVGECRYGTQCLLVHGEVCELCGKSCLHPDNDKQRKEHIEECMKEHERDMELSFAVQRSQDKNCGICMDTVIEKESPVERRFGILENCNHIFCLSCIRKWRSAKQFENKIVRACPECRVCSDFVTPSKFWVEAEEDKKKLIEDYKKALSLKPCKYFLQGRGKCPFAGNCFYLHAHPDGSKVELPPPQPRRRKTNHRGEYDLITRDLLWNFIEERESRYLVYGLEEMLDLIMDSDDDSDYSDLELFLP